MARYPKKNKRKTKRQTLMAGVTGNYDESDFRTDKAILEQMRSQGGLTPRTEAQMERIIDRMRRRSWD